MTKEDTFSTDENLLGITRAILEGRLVPGTKEVMDFDPSVPESIYATKRTEVEDLSVLVPSEPRVAKNWKEIIKLRPEATRDQVLKAQDKYIDYLKTTPLYKDTSDEYFKEYVVKPIYNVTLSDDRWKRDLGVSSFERLLFGVDQLIPFEAGRTFIPTAESMSYKQAYDIEQLAAGLTDKPVNISSLAQSIRQDMGNLEAYDIVKDEITKQESQLPPFSVERTVKQTIPNTIRIATELGILKKPGMPVGVGTMIKISTPGARAAARAANAAYLLGAHEAASGSVQEWYDDPVGKTQKVMSSASLGALIGPIKELVKPAIPRMGIIVGGLATTNYLGARAAGADHEAAIKGFMETVERMLAFELLGYVEGKAARANAFKVARNIYADQLVKDTGMSKADALRVAKITQAAFEQEGTWRISKRLVRDMQKAKEQGILPKEQEQQLKAFMNRAQKKYTNTEKVVKQEEKYFVDKTVSNYPGRIKDQASLEKVGNQMAKDLGIKPELIQFFGRNVPYWKDSKDRATTGDVQFNKSTNKWLIRVALKQGNLKLKQDILHELVHTFKPGIVLKNGRVLGEHPEFKRTETEAYKLIATKGKVEVSPTQKLAMEQSTERQKTTEYINRRISQLKLSTDEVNALVYNATSKVSRHGKHEVKVHGKTSYTSFLDPKEFDLNTLNKIKNSLDTGRSIRYIRMLEAESGVTPNDARQLRAYSRQNLDVYTKLLESLEGDQLPKDRFMRQQFIDQLKSNAIDMRRSRSNVWNWWKGNQRIRVINPGDWQATRKFYDKLSRITGKPFVEMKDVLEESKRIGVLRFMDFAESSLAVTGLTKSQVENLKPSEIRRIVNYLHTNKATYFSAMTSKEKAIASTIRGMLAQDSPMSMRMREIVYNNLENAYSKVEHSLGAALLKGEKKRAGGYVRQFMKFAPSDLKGKPKEAEKWILQGRAAKDAGNWEEFLKSSKIATREYYYMTEHDFDNILKVSDAMSYAPTMKVLASKMRELGLRPGYTLAQKPGAKPDYDTNPFIKALRHAYSVYTHAAAMESARKFSNQLQAVDHMLTPHDRQVNEWYLNSVMGRYQKLSAFSNLMRSAGEKWWRGYSWQPTKVAWFAGRNFPWQNVAVGPTQFSPTEVAKGAARMAKRGGPTTQAIEDFRTIFKPDIDMKHQLWETLTFTNPQIGKTPGIRRLSGLGRFIMTGSDWLNRAAEFFPLHEVVNHNLQQYKLGKLSSRQLFSNLKINTLDGGQKLRIMRYINNKQYDEARKWLLIEKIRNSHYDYQKFGKSVLELDPNNKAWAGLRTWPVSQFEAFYHQGIRPVLRGMTLKNGSMVYEGAKNIAGGVVGHWMAMEGLRHTIGTKGFEYGSEPYQVYGIINWQPLTPGASWFIEGMEQFGTGISATMKLTDDVETWRRKGGSPKGFFDIWASRGAKQIEYFLPLVDVMREITAHTKDKEGVSFYNSLRNLLGSYDARYDKTIKNNYRGWSEKWITGMFGTEYVEHEHFWE